MFRYEMMNCSSHLSVAITMRSRKQRKIVCSWKLARALCKGIAAIKLAAESRYQSETVEDRLQSERYSYQTNDVVEPIYKIAASCKRNFIRRENTSWRRVNANNQMLVQDETEIKMNSPCLESVRCKFNIVTGRSGAIVEKKASLQGNYNLLVESRQHIFLAFFSGNAFH